MCYFKFGDCVFLSVRFLMLVPLFTVNTARRVGFSPSIFLSPLLSLSRRKGSSGTVSPVQYYCITRSLINHP